MRMNSNNNNNNTFDIKRWSQFNSSHQTLLLFGEGTQTARALALH